MRNSVHRFIAYLMVLAILPLLALGVASFEISRSALEDEAKRHLSHVLLERKRYIDLQTDQIESLIANVSGVEAISTGLAEPYDPQDNYSRLLMQARIGYILNGYINVSGLVSIDIFSRRGAQYHVGDTLDVSNVRRDVLAALERQAEASDRPVYWAGIVDNVNVNSRHPRVITAAKKLYGYQEKTSERVPLGLLLVNYSVEYLQEQFGDPASADAIQLALVDGKGQLVYHSDARQIGAPFDSELLPKLSGAGGTFPWKINGGDVLVSYVRSEPSGWPLVGLIPLAAITAHAAGIAKATALVGLLCLTIVVIGAAAYSRQVVAPVRRITERFKQLQADRGRPQEHLPVHGADDVAQLTRWFNAFLDGLREQERAERALQASEARFRTIFEDAGIGMAVLGRDARFQLLNHGFHEMFGYGESELLGKTFGDLIHPDDAGRISVELKSLADEKPRSRRYEARFRRKDGGMLWARVSEAFFPGAARNGNGRNGEAHNGDRVIAAVEDITAQKEADTERRARIAAEAANEAKSLFLAKMSHELRTPLNAILGFAQILQMDRKLDAPERSRVASIQRGGEHLLTLVNDILDLAKVEAGKLDLDESEIAVAPFLRGVFDVIGVKAEQKGLAFACATSPDLPQGVRGDEKRLRQIVLNLLDNAVKFTDHGRVTLRVFWQAPSSLRFEVEDTGAGIAPAETEKIFQPFEQVGERGRHAAGTGLGLAISRQLVRKMGGEIHVESRLGQGSRFWFELKVPIAQPVAAAASARRVVTGVVTGYEGPRKKVLIVDDIAANRALMRDYLEPLGFELHEAENGLNALAKAEEVRPDLVLMDSVMPVMDGIEATERLRRTPGLETVPLVAISAAAFREDKQRSLAAGASAFIAKPIELAALLEQIGALMKIRWTEARAGDS